MEQSGIKDVQAKQFAFAHRKQAKGVREIEMKQTTKQTTTTATTKCFRNMLNY